MKGVKNMMLDPVPMRHLKPDEKRHLFYIYVAFVLLIWVSASILTTISLGLVITTMLVAWQYPILVKRQERWLIISDEEFANDPEAQRDYEEWQECFLASLASE